MPGKQIAALARYPAPIVQTRHNDVRQNWLHTELAYRGTMTGIAVIDHHVVDQTAIEFGHANTRRLAADFSHDLRGRSLDSRIADDRRDGHDRALPMLQGLHHLRHCQHRANAEIWI